MQHKDSKIKKMWKRREETFEDTDRKALAYIQQEVQKKNRMVTNYSERRKTFQS